MQYLLEKEEFDDMVPLPDYEKVVDSFQEVRVEVADKVCILENAPGQPYCDKCPIAFIGMVRSISKTGWFCPKSKRRFSK